MLYPCSKGMPFKDHIIVAQAFTAMGTGIISIMLTGYRHTRSWHLGNSCRRFSSSEVVLFCGIKTISNDICIDNDIISKSLCKENRGHSRSRPEFSAN